MAEGALKIINITRRRSSPEGLLLSFDDIFKTHQNTCSSDRLEDRVCRALVVLFSRCSRTSSSQVLVTTARGLSRSCCESPSQAVPHSMLMFDESFHHILRLSPTSPTQRPAALSRSASSARKYLDAWRSHAHGSLILWPSRALRKTHAFESM